MGRKKTYCNTCDWELDKFESEHPSLHKKNKLDIKLTKEYCEDHTTVYGDDCEPIWCEECGHLKIYQVTKTDRSKNRDLI